MYGLSSSRYTILTKPFTTCYMQAHSDMVTLLIMSLNCQCSKCPLPSFTSQTELTSSLVSYIPKQSSTIHPHGPRIWPGFHDTHANQPRPPALTITNGESSSPIPQSHAHATLPSPRPPTPSGPSQPIDELPLHQNYQQRGSDLCLNSYPSTDIGCLEPNDQNSQFTTSARLIHSLPS